MGLNTLETAYTNGQVIDASHVNEITAAIIGDFIGRDVSGVPSVGQSLGTLAIPWGSIYGESLILNGSVVDTNQIVAQSNRVISGRTRTIGGQPDFLQASGSAASFDIKAATTNLLLSINGLGVSVTTDITKTGITLAPSTNNTATVNSVGLSNDKFLGEDGTVIPITSAGSEFTSRVGQICAFKVGTEIFIGYLKSVTEIVNAYRGFFFDSSRNPVSRANMSHGDTIIILQIGWVFVEDNGTTVDISYTTPVYQYEAPASVTGAYWFDMSVQVWKRYSGASWEIIDRILVGSIVSDDAACKWTRSLDFEKAFSDENTIELNLLSTEIVNSKNINSKVNVYGSPIIQRNNFFNWNITTDLDTGLTEANSTIYYVYVSTSGERIISDVKPFDRRGDLRGYYHPFNDWRCVGTFFNDGSGNITMFDEMQFNVNITEKKGYLKDVKSYNTSGGSASASTLTPRTLNVINMNGSDIDSSCYFCYKDAGGTDFWLIPGKYSMKAFTIVLLNNRAFATLTNVTLNAQIAISIPSYDGGGTLYSGTQVHEVEASFEIKNLTRFRLNTYTKDARATDGLGSPHGISGYNNVYSQVEITKVA